MKILVTGGNGPGRFNASSLEERFAAKVTVGHDGGCWEWNGTKDKNGYGTLHIRGAEQVHWGTAALRMHRYTYITFRGPIPPHLQPDHLCRNTSCVNPWHIELVTPRENVLRNNSPIARQARQTHCKRGHEFTPENTYVYRRMRTCRACDRLRARKVPA